MKVSNGLSSSVLAAPAADPDSPTNDSPTIFDNEDANVGQQATPQSAVHRLGT